MLPEEDIFPRMGKTQNGHTVEIFPVFGMGEGLEEVVFWCHSCDPEGMNIEKVDTNEVSWVTAYYYLGEFAQDHIGIPLQTREKDHGQEDKQE